MTWPILLVNRDQGPLLARSTGEFTEQGPVLLGKELSILGRVSFEEVVLQWQQKFC